MPNLEKRLLTGGADFDDENRLIPPNWFRSATDLSIGSAEDGNVGGAESKRGNQLVPFTLPAGQNRCRGWYEDRLNNRGYVFNWNGNADHHIIEYDPNNGGLNLVLMAAALNFDRDDVITGINMLDGNLYWAEPHNNPRRINVEAAKAGTYAPVTDERISNSVAPSLRQPSVSIVTDPAVNRNNIRNFIFQFRQAFIDAYHVPSAMSPVSEMVAATGNEFTNNAQYYADYLNNNRIDVVVETGSDLVKQIDIFVRQDNDGDWLRVETLDKFDAAGNVLIPSNTTYTYAFYNDRQLGIIDQNYANKNFDFMPFGPRAQEIIEGQRLVYANYVEGRNQVAIDVSLTQRNVDVSDQFINGGLSTFFLPTPISFTSTIYLNVITTQPTGATYAFQAGDVIVLEGASPGLGLYTQEVAQYVITTADVQGTLLQQTTNILTGLKASIDSAPQPAPYSRSTTINPALNNIEINYAIIPGPLATELLLGYGAALIYRPLQKFGTFKKGCTYTFGIEYVDAFGRSSTVMKSAASTLNVPWQNLTGEINYGTVINVDWEVRNLPPDWAESWQWLMEPQKQKLFELEVAVADVSPAPTVDVDANGNSFFYITPLKTYQDQRPNTILAYDWTKGDRVTFILKDPTPTAAPTLVDVEILAYDPAASGGLKVTTQNIQSIGFSISPGALVEIYTPAPKIADSLFFEFGQQFPVLTDLATGRKYHGGETQNQDPNNPAAVPATGTFTRGDTWVRYREYRYGSTPTFVQSYVVEDFNYSDFYSSIDWDKGRPNVYDAQAREVRYGGRIRYSDVAIAGTNINGLSSFADINFEDYGDNFGSIQKLYNENRYLYTFFEQKCGHVPISQVTSVTESGALTYQTDQVLNPIQYYAGRWGIGKNPESFAVFGTAKYFVDVYNGDVLRLSIDGLSPISEGDTRQSNYFTAQFKALLESGVTPRIYGVYDIRFNEYVVAAADTETATGFTFAFNEKKNYWTDHYSYRPEYTGGFGTSIVSFKDGALWLHTSGPLFANWYGVQYQPELEMVFNADPLSMKFWKAITVEADQRWDLVEATNEFGQKTSLIFSDWELKENVWFAALLMNENTPNVQTPILNGDPMRSQTLTVKLRFNGSGYTKLFSVGLLSELSQRTNR